MNEIQDFIEDKNKKVLGYLIKEEDNNKSILLGMHPKQHKWNGFGGHIGDTPEIAKESAEEALRREAFEELGIQIYKPIKKAEIIFTYTDENGITKREIAKIYFIYKWGKKIKSSEGLKKATWFDINKLPWNDMWPSDKIWLEPLIYSEPNKTMVATFNFSYANGNTPLSSDISWL